MRTELSMPAVKLVVVEFYATWCKPCMEAVPKWKALHEKYRASGLRFIVVSAEGRETCAKPPDWSPDKSLCDENENIQKQFKVKGALPQSFLFSWEGNIAMTSHTIEPVEDAINRYFRENHLKMIIDKVEVFGEKYAVSGNPEWLRSFIAGQVRDFTKLDVVASSETAIPKHRADTCDRDFPPNSTLRITLHGDDRGNRQMAVALEKDGCILGSVTEPYRGSGLLEDVDSMKSAAVQAVRRLFGTLVSVKQAKLVEGLDDWFNSAAQELVLAQFKPNPDGAVVIVDGEMKCKNTPCAVSLPMGAHEVVIQAEEYQPIKRTLAFNKNEIIDWQLKPNFGWVTVNADPPDADLILDDKPVGKAPLKKFKLPTGPHAIKATAPCRYEAHQSFVISAGEDATLEIKPRSKEGGLQVTAEDAKGNAVVADVYLDGNKIGTTPGKWKVSVCSSKLEVKAPAGTFRQNLALEEKKVVSVRAALSGISVLAKPDKTAEKKQDVENKLKGVHEHDGFFLRLKLGTGFEYGIANNSNLGNVNISGPPFVFNLSLGGALTRNLILYMDSGVEVTARTDTRKYDTNTTITVTPGLIYYFIPSNVYVGFSLGYGLIWFDVIGFENSLLMKPTSGCIGNVYFGREWWISNNWGIGVMGEYSFGYYLAKLGYSILSTGIFINTFGLFITATYN
jgi:thiol-disulfide isomerase/thioredoxin